MTTNNVGGYSPSYDMNGAGKTQKAQKESGEKVEGNRPPPPPPKKQDTYVPSEEATEYLATMEELAEETATAVVTPEVSEEADVSENSSESQVETSKGIDVDTVNKLKADLKLQSADFIKKMAGMIQGQAGTALTASANLFEEIAQGNFTVTEEEQAEAQEAISEDGYWGVEATANRIVDMAKALAGGDASKASEMMSYIEEGFAAAEDVWGSELPSITSDTKARIDELFADWTGDSSLSIS